MKTMSGFDSRPRLQGDDCGQDAAKKEAEILPALAMPPGVICDGKWPLTDFFCFTDQAPDSPARGASFDVFLPAGISETEALGKISEALANMRRKFSNL